MGHYDEQLERYYDKQNMSSDTTKKVSIAEAFNNALKAAIPDEDPINYKFSEDRLLKEIIAYVNKTYGQHYAQNKYQATEFIIDCGHGIGFTIGDILKYAQRYGHKGTPDDWRKDLMKIIHYAIIALHIHDQNHSKEI